MNQPASQNNPVTHRSHTATLTEVQALAKKTSLEQQIVNAEIDDEEADDRAYAAIEDASFAYDPRERC